MLKLDLRKELKYLYQPSAKQVTVVQVPRFQFAMLDGQIEAGQGPSTSASFQEALQALYGISYTLKFTSKLRKENPVDYPVMALEGLWWIEGGEFDIHKKDNWLYTVMMLQPDFITAEMYGEALAQLRKKRGDNPSLAKMRLEPFEEGLCVQVMHIGPYADEPATVERMKSFARENGYRDLVGLGGKHHEIYLGDPRRADPAKLKTVLRHPIEKNV
ncbi:MAG: GyrI-like domain-containing protein [Chloroflexi bacterium]|nr:GyrI-like domain-containing protein [Chloroflexota bacterium]